MDEAKPHVVCIPFPLQSHITAMMNFAKLLHHKGFHITFVNTYFNHTRLLKSQGPKSLDVAMPNFSFETIPDGLPATDLDASQDMLSLSKAIKNNLLAPFLHLIRTKLNSPSINVPPPPTCFLADFFLPFIHEAGKELGIPVMTLSTVSATTIISLHKLRALTQNGYSSTKGETSEKLLELIPGMKNLRFMDIIRIDNEENLKFILTTVEASATRNFALIINSLENLEPDEFEDLASIYGRVYACGPIHLISQHIPKESLVNSIKSNLWIEESKCLQWLDSNDPCSVIYVNFGSIAVMTTRQIIEIAQGLVDCKHKFLWVIRPDLLKSSILPLDFKDQTKDRGFIASWCHQEKVLNHSSIGAFLTHCGWNSTLESIGSGVPMICRPFFGDQPTNCRYICAVWNVGIEMEIDMRREDVIKAVTEVMETEEGKRLKERAMTLRKMVQEAADPSSSSSMNLDKVLNQLILNI